MPYIVTTVPRGCRAKDMENRRAVAKLGDARELADDAVYGAYDRERRPGAEMPSAYFEHSTQARELPYTGGAIGPLPDGTVIEIEAHGWAWLGMRAFPSEPLPKCLEHSNADAIAVYNQRRRRQQHDA